MSAWTREQVIELAPDAASKKAGQAQAQPAKWPLLARSERALWGEVQGSGKNPYQVQIDLLGPAFKCSCPSRKFPCKHALGLLLIAVDAPTAMTAAAMPDQVAEWVKSRDARAAKPAQPDAKSSKDIDLEAQARRAAARRAKVASGIDELRRFLDDLLTQGLASSTSRSTHSFAAMAARLVDNQAPGLAARLRAFDDRRHGDGWQQDLVAGMARLHLLLNAYERQRLLPANLRADVDALIGFTIDKEQVLSGDDVAQRTVRDRWAVVGLRHISREQVTERRLWLWGLGSDRPALVIDFLVAGRAPDHQLAPGSEVDAELVFYPGALGRRALIQQVGETRPVGQLPGAGDLEAVLTLRARGLARSPWENEWPVALAQARPGWSAVDGWTLHDRDGRALKLRTVDELGWTVRALAARQPVGVFGEGAGDVLKPLSWWTDAAFFYVVEGSQRLSRVVRRPHGVEAAR